MALFTMKLENLEQLFLQELRDLYDAEDQITEALPKMIEAAHYPELKNALQEHLDVTRTQIQRSGPGVQHSGGRCVRRDLQGHEGRHQGRRRDHLPGRR